MKTLSSNLIQIAKILSDLNYHDGDSIGLKLKITRSAVWKSIKKLEEYGIEISSVKNKGYKLIEPLLLIDKEEIEKELASPNLKIEVFESIYSTSNYLKNNLDPLYNKICLAEMQTNGRGRMQRFWYSPFGKNIYFSYAYKFKKDVSELGGLSLAVGIATINAIKEIGINLPIKLKWPNDGIYEEQKLFGILIELSSESYSETTAIIGIGIDINMLEDENEITQSWTSLLKMTGEYIDRNKLIIALIHNLNYILELFSKFGLREFISQWNSLDALNGKKVKLTINNYEGIVQGINEQGHLLLKLENGEIKSFSSGEASILKE